MINIKNSFVALTLLLSLKAVATPLSPTEALQRYEKQHSNTISRTNDTAAFKIKLTVEQPGTLTPALYVFEKTNNNGFIILSADDIAPAVLGYCDKGKIDDDNMPPSFRYWLDEYSRQIAYLIKNNTSSLSGFPRVTEILGDPVETMVETLWNQGTPYNNICPEVGGKKCLTGCVATAMAQVMRYFKYPDVGVGHITYYPFDDNVPYSMDFSEKRFDWDNMIDTYQGQNYTPVQADAVAYLMKACGYSVNMMYGVSASSAYTDNIRVALIKYFSYAPTAKTVARTDNNNLQWIQDIYDNIKNIGPAIISASSQTSAHAFIVDGYNNEGYFHINWGWGGLYDGFFLIDALNPYGDDGYNYNQYVTIGMQPQSLENGGGLIIDNIFYLVDGKTQTATCMGPASDGLTFENLVIRAYVNFLGIDIPVTSIVDRAFYGCSTLTTIDLSDCIELQSIGDWVFYDCSNLTTIGDTSGWTKLQSIGERAFYDCSALTTIDLSGCTELQSIGEQAFADCSNLTTIGDTSGCTELQSIGERAFFYCSALTAIDLSGCTKLQSIGEQAFDGCSALTTIDLSGCTELQSIGNWAFSGCLALTKIDLSDCTELQSIPAFSSYSALTTIDLSGCTKLQSIGNSAFYGCSALTTIDLSGCTELQSIGEGAFYGCSSLTTIDLSGCTGLQSIGNSAFYSCSPLTTIGDTSGWTKLQSIGDWAFAYCSNLTTIGDTSGWTKLQSIGEGAFLGCSALTTIDLSGCTELQSIGTWAFSGCLALTTIGDTSDWTKLQSIGEQAFSGCSALTKIDLSGCTELQSIGVGAFLGCSALTKIDLSGCTELQSIGNSAFNRCSSLTTIGDTSGWTELQSIGDWAFGYCSSLTTVDLTGLTKLQSIGERAFFYCSALTAIGLSGYTELQSIGEQAFYGCSALTTIDLSGCTKLQSIGEQTFYGCSALTTIGDTSGWTKLQSIGEGAFYGCSDLTAIDLSGCTELQSIGNSAFAYCSVLTTIGDTSGWTKLQSIGNLAFEGCSSLTTIDLSGCTELQSIGNSTFSLCSALTTIGDTSGWAELQSIGSSAFYGCSALTTIDLSGCTELQSIGSATFSGCSSLTDVKLPSSVTSMAFGDFTYCYNLTSVTCYAEEPPVVESTMDDPYNSPEFFSEPMTTSGILYVRAGSEEKYRNAAGWKDAYHILPIVYEDETFTIDRVNYQTLSETTCAIGDNSNFDGPTELTIPATVIHHGQEYAVIKIFDKAFSNSDNLVIIDLSGCTQLQTIGDYVFNNCSSLLSVILPSTLKNIGTDFLAGCNSLETIVSYATEPPVISPSADSYSMRILSSAKALSSKTVLFVPASSVAAYESAEGWNEVSLTIPIGGVETLMLPMSAEVTEEEVTEIEAVYTPSTAPSPEIEWTISDENHIAMLHEKLGEPYTTILEAVSDGTCTLTAYNPQTGLKAECEVTVMTSSGIESLFDDDNDAPIDVFDLNGRVVKLNMESSGLKELRKGIYIIRQGETAKKVMVK